MFNSFAYEDSNLSSLYMNSKVCISSRKTHHGLQKHALYVSFLMSRKHDFEAEKQSRGKEKELSASALQRPQGEDQGGMERLKVKIRTTVEDSGMDTLNLWGRVATVMFHAGKFKWFRSTYGVN